MFPMLVGFGSALLFGLFAFGTYGPEGVTGYAWISMVISALIVIGLLVFFVNRRVPCWLCRLMERIGSSGRWCASGGSAKPC